MNLDNEELPPDWATCLRVLQEIADNPRSIEGHDRMIGLVARIHKQGKRDRRKVNRQTQQDLERALNRSTGIVQQAMDSEPVTDVPPPAGALLAADGTVGAANGGEGDVTLGDRADASSPTADGSPSGSELPAPAVLSSVPVVFLPRKRPCYVCKQPFQELHFFYHQLCPTCAAFNYAKRDQSADLSGRVALLTGGRIKIGYQIALRLLRDGARVYLTTRFPQDAVRRFAAEPDFARWEDRLKLVGLDLRRIPDVENLADWLASQEGGLDIIIHNAAQTVKRPIGFYRHMLEAEAAPDRSGVAAHLVQQLPAPRHHAGEIELSSAADWVPLMEAQPNYPGHISTVEGDFPSGIFDGDGQQLDARDLHSWMLKMEQVSTVELVEVQVVNSIAPFILNSRLKPLLARSRFARRFIVNVSAMEGQFARQGKTPYHPHTNMAKAALNMMTRTSAADYAESGIYMNSVDTGWITDENPLPKKQRVQQETGFFAPLDSTDGMARCYDPIARGINEPGEPLFGHFLKDFKPYAW